MIEGRFEFWIKYLKVVSLFLAFLGIIWAVLGSFDPFGIYDQLFAQTFWREDQLPADAKQAFQFILGPLGATNLAYFLLLYFVVKYAFPKRELWAYHAVVYSFLAWFVLDTSMCLFYKGYFNILIANVPALIGMMPVFFMKRYFN